jgi:hypothetical protein
METCQECQAFFADDFAFEEVLRGSARSETRFAIAMPDGAFEQRILRAVRESEPEAESERAAVAAGQRKRALSLTWSLAGAAAGIALALIVAQRNTPEKAGPQVVTTQPKPMNETTPSREGTEIAGGATETPLRWWRSLDAGESAIALAAKNPLEQEIESISTDAQSVLGFLALNFLPTETATTKSPAGEQRKHEAGQG